MPMHPPRVASYAPSDTKDSFLFCPVTPSRLVCNIPVVYSTFAPQALIHWIREHYDIDPPHVCRFWHRGLSDVYLLESASQSYILRICHHHWRTGSEIDFELNLLSFLASHQLPVSSPLRTKDDHLSLGIQAPEGERYAALFPMAPGNVVVGDLNISQSWVLGEVVAKLHHIGHGFTPIAHRFVLDLDYLLDQSLQAITGFLRHQPQDWHYLLETCAGIRTQLESLPMEAPYWGICWGDPHSGNVHFTPTNQPTLFDFDQCGYGWRAFDLAKFLQVALQTGLSRTVREAFVQGYQSFIPLTNLEYKCLQPLVQTAYIWSWAIQVTTLTIQDYSRLDSHYFTKRLERLRHLGSADLQLF